jgi:signal transduction histidine kinase
VPADPGQLRQVVVNLVTNASDAVGRRGGSVVLRTGLVRLDEPDRYSPHAATDLAAGALRFLEVEDDGCGMTAETRERVFDPFFSTKFTGRGLGLAAVLGIVRSSRADRW